MRRVAAALLMATTLAGCNASTRLEDVRPRLPPMAASCMAHKLPPYAVGKPLPVFALENRRSAILNALAVGNCRKFYAEVRAAYGVE